MKYITRDYTIWIIVCLIITVIIVAAVLIAIYGSKITTSISKNKQINKLNKELDSEINIDEVSISDSQFSTYADSLYTAMKSWGTDEQTIYAVFMEMTSRSDVLKLIKAFGVRDEETLTQWLHGDLTSSEIKKLNKILKDNGIDYQF